MMPPTLVFYSPRARTTFVADAVPESRDAVNVPESLRAVVADGRDLECWRKIVREDVGGVAGSERSDGPANARGMSDCTTPAVSGPRRRGRRARTAGPSLRSDPATRRQPLAK